MGQLLQNTELNPKHPMSFHRQNWMLADTQNQLEQQRLEAMQRLTGGIAHHLNNALQTIMGSAELAKQRGKLPDSVKQDIDRINEEGEKTAQLIRQLIEFSHQAIADRILIHLAAVVEQFVHYQAYTLPDSIGITLNIEKACESLVIKANLKQIQQVLTHLVANAKDAMPSGGELNFKLSLLSSKQSQQLFYPATKPKDWLVLSVSDTGSGIAPQDLPYIFEPFFTTKEFGSGNGLGLAQVYGIVKQLGGDIEVNSKPKQGTTITLYLPIHALLE